MSPYNDYRFARPMLGKRLRGIEHRYLHTNTTYAGRQRSQQLCSKVIMIVCLVLLAIITPGFGKHWSQSASDGNDQFRDPSTEYRPKFRYW